MHHRLLVFWLENRDLTGIFHSKSILSQHATFGVLALTENCR